jgi:hypothetical protein
MLRNEFVNSQMIEAALELAVGVGEHYEGKVVLSHGNAVMLTFPSADHKFNYIKKCSDAFKHMDMHEVISLPGLKATVKVSF